MVQVNFFLQIVTALLMLILYNDFFVKLTEYLENNRLLAK